MAKDIFRFQESGEDDGSRTYASNGRCLCNLCGAEMLCDSDEEERVEYYICPECGFIAIESYWDDEEDDDYEEYWPEDEDDEDDD